MKYLDIKTLPKDIEKNNLGKKIFKTKHISKSKRRFEKIVLPKTDGSIKKILLKSVKTISIALLVFIVFLGMTMAVYASTFRDIYKSAIEGKNHLLTAQDQLKNQQIEQAHNSLKQAKQSFDQADTKFKKIRWLKIVPVLGRQVGAADRILQASIQTTNTLDQTFGTAKTIFSSVMSESTRNLYGITAEQKGQIMEGLHEAAPTFQGALNEIELAQIQLDRTPHFGVLRQLTDAKNTLDENLGKIKEILQYATIASRVFPGIAGYPDEQTYLFLFQNNTEMRPTGGFIGSYGILKIKNGEITSFNTEDVYNLDNASNIEIRPPEPMIRYLGINNWHFRDSNWSPDFPQAAQKAEWFYHEEGGKEELDGVIAITPTVIEELMKVTGPIVIPGYDYEFTAENVTELLQFQVEQGFETSLEYRKKIIGDFSDTLFHTLLSLPKEKWESLAKTVKDVFEKKHILLYLDNEETQKIIAEYNGDGRIKQIDGDSLLVVDCNLGALKSDPQVKRTIDYSVDFTQPEPKAKVVITYENQVQEFTWKTTRYQTYTRIYIPEGSNLVNISGYVEGEPTENNDEYSKKALGAYIKIEPQESKQLIFEYTLPQRIKENIQKDKKYTILVQKQPGTISHTLNLELKFDDKILTFTPEDKGSKIGNNTVMFNTDLTYDREFRVEF